MSKTTLVALLALALATNALPEAYNHRRIAGGDLAKQGQFPAVVSFIRGVCTGVIIGNHWVLTTASCVTHVFPSGHYVFAGNVDKSSDDGQVSFVSRYVLHHDFKAEALSNNVALIRVIDDFVYDLNVEEAEIAPVAVNTSCTLVGRGAHQRDQCDSLQRYADNMVVLDSAECGRRWGLAVDDGEFCAFGGEGRGPCGSDVGSPLFHDKKLVGILSNQIDYCVEDKPQVYVNVARYGRWIWENTGIVV